MTIFPLDANNHPIPALRLKSGGAHSINAGAVSARNAQAFSGGTQVVSVYATVPVFIRMGDSAVNASASDHYFPEGVYYDFAVGGAAAAHCTHIAVLRAGTTDGKVYISEKE